MRRLCQCIAFIFFFQFLALLFIVSPLRHFYSHVLHSEPQDDKTLLICGGGTGTNHSLFDLFIELSGGIHADIVIVTTAASSSPRYRYYKRSPLAEYARTRGVQKVTVLHTHDRKEADSEEFVKPLLTTSGLWFGEGRQFRLVDAYGGTRTERAFHEILHRGGTIGGSSAGASIQGSFLVRGDTSSNQIVIGDHQKGFGFLKNSAIDQHVIVRGRQFDMIQVLEDPEQRMDPAVQPYRKALVGFGIDENTAMLVRGDCFQVVGDPGGVVLVYDPKQWKPNTPNEKKIITLPIGSKYCY